jgi:predicted PurR-regulated permease PerM
MAETKNPTIRVIASIPMGPSRATNFIVGESVSNYVLSPYLVGAHVNLDPVWVIFAISAFGYLFGFVGLLIAVPLAASIGVLVRFAIAQYSLPAPGGSHDGFDD